MSLSLSVNLKDTAVHLQSFPQRFRCRELRNRISDHIRHAQCSRVGLTMINGEQKSPNRVSRKPLERVSEKKS